MGEFFYEPKWDGFRALVFRGSSDVFIQSRDLRPLDRYFPELHEAAIESACRPGRSSTARSSSREATRSISMRSRCACIPPRHASRSSRKRFRRRSSVSTSWRPMAVTSAARRSIERRAALERLLARTGPPIHLTPVTRDRELAVDWLARFEGPGLDGVIAKPLDLTSTSQASARCSRSSTSARRTAWSAAFAGTRAGATGRLAAARAVRSRGHAPPRRDHIGLHDGGARRRSSMSSRRFASERARRPPVARLGRGRRLTDAGRPEPLERRKRSFVGTAPHRARGGSEIRPPAGQSISSRDDLSALAAGQTAEGLPLRSAGSHRALRALTGVRRTR